MQMVFLHGPPAAGKLTVARELAARTGMALFHNHLVVDAVGALFAFGSADFVRLRERWWLDAIGAAARGGRSLIFTFAPERSVAADFPARVAALVAPHGRTHFISLTVSPAVQEARLSDAGRRAFGKLTSLDLLRALRADFAAAEAAMPASELTIDTEVLAPAAAAAAIVRALDLPLVS